MAAAEKRDDAVLAAARQEAKAEKIHQVALQVAVPEHYGYPTSLCT